MFLNILTHKKLGKYVWKYILSKIQEKDFSQLIFLDKSIFKWIRELLMS